MSGHSCIQSHWIDLERLYETVHHLICHCERFGSERHRLIDALSELDVLHGTPVWVVLQFVLFLFQNKHNALGK
jgi:hypothetical protein